MKTGEMTMYGQVKIAINSKTKQGYLIYPDNTKSPKFIDVAGGAYCFLQGVMDDKLDPDDLKNTLERLKSTCLPHGSLNGTPYIVVAVKAETKPPGYTAPSAN